jgi:hypothetical protein
VSVQITTYERSTLVNSEKYIGLDVHQATIVVAVMDSTGKLVMESILGTKAATILQFFAGLRGTLSVTFEEGTWSAWLYDLLHSRVDKLVVCNPRKMPTYLAQSPQIDTPDVHPEPRAVGSSGHLFLLPKWIFPIRELRSQRAQVPASSMRAVQK